MKKNWTIWFAGVLFVCGSGGYANAGPTIDQSNLPAWAGAWTVIGNVPDQIRTGQTFQPGLPVLSGLDIDILTANPGRGDDTITVQVLLHGTLVGTASQLVHDGFDGLLHFDFSSPVAVDVTRTYTLWVYDGDDRQTFGWKYGGDTYPRGTAIFFSRSDPTADFRFQTYAGGGVFAWHGPTVSIATGVIGNPSFIQALPGTYGTKGNYELVVPLQGGGIGQFERNNDDPNLPWSMIATFGTSLGGVNGVSLIQSNFSSAGNGPGNLAAVSVANNELDYFERDDALFAWQGPIPITTGVVGVPSLIQARPGTYGTKGDYELVVPLATGGIAAFSRANDDPNLTWSGPVIFGTDLGVVDAVCLVQSNLSTQAQQTGVQGPGNLAVVARVGSDLVYFYREDIAPFDWHGPTMTVATGVTGNPSFVQVLPGTYGTMGNYELIVPLQSGGIGQFERNNDDPTLPWSMITTFGSSLGGVNGVSLIQSNFSTAGNGPGNLAAVSAANNELDYFYRDDQ